MPLRCRHAAAMPPLYQTRRHYYAVDIILPIATLDFAAMHMMLDTMLLMPPPAAAAAMLISMFPPQRCTLRAPCLRADAARATLSFMLRAEARLAPDAAACRRHADVMLMPPPTPTGYFAFFATPVGSCALRS